MKDYSGKLRSNDPHAVAGVLKKFFRELPEPLFTLESHKAFLETLKVEQTAQPGVLRPLIESLPALNLRIIRHMIPFLFLISKHKDRNMMNVQNLSIVFGPTFMRYADCCYVLPLTLQQLARRESDWCTRRHQ